MRYGSLIEQKRQDYAVAPKCRCFWLTSAAAARSADFLLQGPSEI
jgi:hypothetical protein